MLIASDFSAVEKLRDGRPFEIRSFRPGDQADLASAIARVSPQSIYRRFFTAKRAFTDAEKEFFLNVDFIRQVALLAWVREADRQMIAGGGRYVIDAPGTAELAFVVLDQYQGQGIGSALLRHLIAIARAARLQRLTAEVLAENVAMLKVFEKCGLPLKITRSHEIVHVVFELQ